MAVSVYILNVGQASCAAILDPHPSSAGGLRQSVLIDMGVDGRRLAEWLLAETTAPEITLISVGIVRDF